MKECLSCHKQVEDLRHTCLYCGGTMFMGAGLSTLDTMQKQAEAAKYVDRGAQFIRQERYAEAERELRKAIEINPMNATAHGNMGGVFLRQGRPEDAIPWLEKALELNPHLEGVPQALAKARVAIKEKMVTPEFAQASIEPTIPCEACGAIGSCPYTFYYGEKHKHRGYGSGSAYVVKGSSTVYLCDRCVFKQRLRQAWMGFLSAAIAVGSGYLSLVYYDDVMNRTIGAVLAMGMLFGGYFAITRLVRVFKSKGDVGAYRAIRLRQRELEKQGHKSFWIHRPS